MAQIRVLLSGVRSKTSTGSGFFVSADGLILTNYHVISALALEPDRYGAEYVGADGSSGPLVLVAVDAPHDLALLRAERRGGAVLALALADEKQLRSGDRIFALGNPLDLGFALAEGTFNGTIEQHFYEQIFFTGALNPGMSGGPALDEEGRVVGVNVAKRLDGELVSFLVPAARAVELLARGRDEADGEGRNFKAIVTGQLLEHQELVAERLLAVPLPTERLGQYRVPASPGEWVRCWAGRAPDKKAHVAVESHHCSANTAVFVSDRLSVGGISIAHQFGSSPSSLRFLRRHGREFGGEEIGPRRGGPVMGATLCVEDFVESPPGVLRVVVCSRAYREHVGLYDFVVAAASSDSSRAGLRTQLQVNGFSHENGLRIVRHLLEGIRWNGPES
ncbi:MAG TPA: serine protease [Thermoanaerobaculia bacterium]|nr:serine protease [Thermoanaerobaculia bacterium]